MLHYSFIVPSPFDSLSRIYREERVRVRVKELLFLILEFFLPLLIILWWHRRPRLCFSMKSLITYLPCSLPITNYFIRPYRRIPVLNSIFWLLCIGPIGILVVFDIGSIGIIYSTPDYFPLASLTSYSSAASTSSAVLIKKSSCPCACST